MMVVALLWQNCAPNSRQKWWPKNRDPTEGDGPPCTTVYGKRWDKKTRKHSPLLHVTNNNHQFSISYWYVEKVENGDCWLHYFITSSLSWPDTECQSFLWVALVLYFMACMWVYMYQILYQGVYVGPEPVAHNYMFHPKLPQKIAYRFDILYIPIHIHIHPLTPWNPISRSCQKKPNKHSTETQPNSETRPGHSKP